MDDIGIIYEKQTLALSGIICVLLTGCATDSLNIQLTPEEASTVVLKNEPETVYILPTYLNADSITFASYDSMVSSSKYEMLDWRFEQDTLRVERRTHNGIAGSGVVYEVERKVLPDSHNVIFVPKVVSKYQDGLVLPYPVPQFDINSFLATSFFVHEFEVDAEYNPEAIESNFNRLLNAMGNNRYGFNLDNAEVIVTVQVYPYRNGSKAVVKSNIKTTPSNGSQFNIEELYRKVELRIASVVNA